METFQSIVKTRVGSCLTIDEPEPTNQGIRIEIDDSVSALWRKNPSSV